MSYPAGAEITAIDFSDRMLRRARERGARVTDLGSGIFKLIEATKH